MLADDVGWDTADLAVKYGKILRNYFARRVSTEEADDLVQEVFLKLQSTKLGGPVQSLEGYLFSTANSVLIDFKRNSAKSGLAPLEFWDDAQEASAALSPERIAIANEEYICLMHVISRLPSRTRQAFELHRFENLTYQAISVHMGISKESVKDLMHRALLRIAVELKAIQ